MDRRAFVKTAAAGAATLFIPSLLEGCGASTELALKPWAGPPPSEQDIRLKALAYAVLAPNPHNTQAWQLDLSRPGEIDLYVDPKRLLPATDPPFRQIHIGQGTFLEVLEIAARELGHRAEMTYFPKGEYANDTLEDKPVATVRLTADPSVEKDPLFAQITRRVSNKRPWIDPERALSAAQLAAVTNVRRQEGQTIRVFTDGKKRAELANLARDGMAAEVTSWDRNAETSNWLRFGAAELEAHRDGFTIENAGTTGFKKWFAESFLLDHESAKDPNKMVAKGAISAAYDQAASASAFATVITETNTRRDQVLAGRTHVRTHLTMTALGVAMHPMSQLLQEYADMTSLKARLKSALGATSSQTVQMFFRLGFADPTIHTPRRPVADLIRRA